MKYIYFFLFFSLCLSVAAESASGNANFFFTKINGETGLSQVNVKSIIQDSYGFMWFGTRNRLNRYDGTRIKIFDCYDLVQRNGNNNISVLFEDDEKNIWVGTDKGIYIFDPIYETFTQFNYSTSDNIKITDWVSDIQKDLDNNIWIVIPNEGVFRYNLIIKRLFHYPIGNTMISGNPQCMCIEKNGTVWVGSNGGGVYQYNKSSDSFIRFLGNKNGHSLEGENIYTMCDYGEELVLGIHEGRLRKFNKRKNTTIDVNAPEVH